MGILRHLRAAMVRLIALSLLLGSCLFTLPAATSTDDPTTTDAPITTPDTVILPDDLADHFPLRTLVTTPDGVSLRPGQAPRKPLGDVFEPPIEVVVLESEPAVRGVLEQDAVRVAAYFTPETLHDVLVERVEVVGTSATAAGSALSLWPGLAVVTGAQEAGSVHVHARDGEVDLRGSVPLTAVGKVFTALDPPPPRAAGEPVYAADGARLLSTPGGEELGRFRDPSDREDAGYRHAVVCIGHPADGHQLVEHTGRFHRVRGWVTQVSLSTEPSGTIEEERRAGPSRSTGVHYPNRVFVPADTRVYDQPGGEPVGRVLQGTQLLATGAAPENGWSRLILRGLWGELNPWVDLSELAFEPGTFGALIRAGRGYQLLDVDGTVACHAWTIGPGETSYEGQMEMTFQRGAETWTRGVGYEYHVGNVQLTGPFQTVTSEGGAQGYATGGAELCAVIGAPWDRVDLCGHRLYLRLEDCEAALSAGDDPSLVLQ